MIQDGSISLKGFGEAFGNDFDTLLPSRHVRKPHGFLRQLLYERGLRVSRGSLCPHQIQQTVVTHAV